MLRAYASSNQVILKAEMDLYGTISPEEWELLRPDPGQRVSDLLMRMKVFLKNQGTCGNCTSWEMRSAELKNDPTANNIDVGLWEPMQGLMLKDDLFPHVTGGFRGRTLKVASTNVS